MRARSIVTRALFLDCDDCLYQNSWATAKRITESIGAYTQGTLGVSTDQAYALYKQHGTCLKGLLAEGLLDEAGAEAYLQRVHDIDYSDIQPDPRLNAVLGTLRPDLPTWIFTASIAEHAARCIDRLQLTSLRIRGTVDTRTCKLETKHSASSFAAAMEAAEVTDAAGCVLCDDSIKNVVAAKAAGWQTVLVGLTDRDTGEAIPRPPEADFHIGSLHSLPEVMPELFAPP